MSMRASSRISAGSGDDAHEAIVRAAAEWHTRVDSGLSAGAQEQFERWLEADARHAEVFGEMDATWALLELGAALSPAQMGVTANGRALTLMEVDMASDPRRPRASTVRRFALPLAAAVCVAISAAVLLRAPDDRVTFADVAAEGAGAFKRVNLPDGSVARLNSATEIAVEYRRRERHVRLLRGEAHFTVAKDAARPFVVEASGLAVRAVGTAFIVSTRAGAIEILVTEGKVQLESSGETRGTPAPSVIALAASASLAAGERALVPFASEAARPEFTRVSPAEIAAALAWQQRLLSFDATSLGEIVEAFNGYNRHRLVVADPELARRCFGGSFRADDPEGFLALLSATSDVVIEHRDRETIIRRTR